MHPWGAGVMGALAMLLAVLIYLIVAHAAHWWPAQRPTPSPTPTPSVLATPTTVQYEDTQYGFRVSLPDSWRDFKIQQETWTAYVPGQNGNVTVGTGPQIEIVHPLSTADIPRQNIPIMVFTYADWDHLQRDEWHIGAAPFNPTELARNNQYIFALPARYNYAFPTGYQEVERILQGGAVQAF